MKSLNVSVLIILTFFTVAYGEDWPSWRGSKSNGISEETGWNPNAIEKPENILWNKNVGNGWTAVSTWGNYLFTAGNIDNKDIVYCLEMKTGKEIWRFTYDCPAGNFPGIRATPVVDDNRVYALGRNGNLYCLEAKNGTIIWQKQLIQDFEAQVPTWGFSATPKTEGELLLLNACSSGIALNKKTGAAVWVSKSGICGYAAPVVYEMDGKKSIAIFSQNKLFGVDLRTGNVQWSFPWQTEYDINAADPIFHNNRIFITSGYGRGCALLDITGNKAKKVWDNTNLSSHFSSSIFFKGYIYGCDGNAGRNASLICMDWNTGKKIWSEELGYHSLIWVDEKCIVSTERGELIIASADQNGYRELSRVTVLRTSRSSPGWTAPVLSNGKIFCRSGGGELVCIDVSK